MEKGMLLEVSDLDAGYGFLQILRKVSLTIDTGEFVCIIGPNGAGKSTTMKTIAGLIRPSAGKIVLNGEEIQGLPGNEVARKGVVYVSEEMNLFTNMTVAENLLMGAYTVKDKNRIKNKLAEIYDLFPRLKERRPQLAGTMSGGERKMLAIGRGLMSSPMLLLVDEPSFGLAPQTTDAVFDALTTLNRSGMSILVVEQNVAQTLAVTGRGYVLENGIVEMGDTSDRLATNAHVRKIFLGV